VPEPPRSRTLSRVRCAPALLLFSCVCTACTPATTTASAHSPVRPGGHTEPSQSSSATDLSRVERGKALDMRVLCARDVLGGIDECQKLAPDDSAECADRCFYDYHHPDPAPSRHVVVADRAPHRRRAPPPAPTSSTPPKIATMPPPSVAPPIATTAPPLPTIPEDPFTVALHECIRRVREEARPPICPFFRPLDAMDFGQRHCDARCAELSGASSIAPPSN
jgi:hypothetical protein